MCIFLFVFVQYIFGGHISEYMKALKEENEEAYNTQFKRYVDLKIAPEAMEALYTKAHAAIRADPTKKRADTELGYFGVRGKNNPKPKVSVAFALCAGPRGPELAG